MRLGELILLEAKDEYVVKAFGPKIATVAKLKASSDEVREKLIVQYASSIDLPPTTTSVSAAALA